MVGVAQLVEHLVVVQVVAGSSPVTHPKARAICVRGKREPGRLLHLCAVASLRAGGGFATRTPCAFASLGSGGWGCLLAFGRGWGCLLAFVAAGVGWQDGAVKSSGSLWLGYGVVLVVTFGVGFLAFVVWVLSKVF
jgi:hypothetical protein